MLFSKSKDKSITRILFSGMICLAISLIACMLHVIDVKEAFRKENEDNFRGQMQASGLVLSGYLERTQKTVRTATEVLSRPTFMPTDNEIYNIIRKYGDTEEFSEFIYIHNNGMAYTANESKEKLEDAPELRSFLNMQEESLQVWVDTKDGKKQDVIVYSSPVRINVQVIGHVVALKKIDNMLSDPSLEYLYSQGHCFIVSESGLILDRSDGAKELIGNSKNLYDGLIIQGFDSNENRLQIRDFQEKMKTQSHDTLRFLTMSGDYMVVSYQSIDTNRNLFFVSCYSEAIMQQKIQPVIFRSALTCMLIIVLMIALLLYVWASSKYASTAIEQMAYLDSVTGGKNLNYFKRKITDILRSHTELPFLILRFDVANFRYINEAYGHTRADELLKGCVQLSKKHFLEREFCVRMDADQFVALCINDEKSKGRREDYEKSLNQFARTIGIKYPIRLKFGIYQVRKQDKDVDVVIDRANVARKSLDSEEKKLVAYYSDTIVNAMRRVDHIESEMQKALATKEFKIYLQPKWDIVEDRLVGAEALVRWQKSSGTIISPSEFIPVFEKNGFIEKLDFYMLDTICKYIEDLLKEGVQGVPISVNQSRFLLNNPDYVKNVKRVLEEYTCAKEYLELELTETVFFEEKDRMISIMKELKGMGIVWNMDDFGSGFSSLSLLKDIPFDIIKIDRTFFNESITSKSSLIILQKIVEMVAELGMKAVCEGVEEAEQIEVLRELGCRYVQGFYYSQPISIEEFTEKYYGVIYELSD